MSMNIKNKETYRLTKELSKLTGESLTTAVTEAVRERLDRVRREQGINLAKRLLLIGQTAPRISKTPTALSIMTRCSMTIADYQNDYRYVIAILRDEPEAPLHARAIADATDSPCEIRGCD